jgi:YD repeat-containing protein
MFRSFDPDDILGRQLTAKFDSAVGSDGITNTYNGFGELLTSELKMATSIATLRSHYDGAGRRNQLIHPENTSTYSFTYAYDALGRLSGLYQGTGTTACSAVASGTLLDCFTCIVPAAPGSLVRSRISCGFTITNIHSIVGVRGASNAARLRDLMFAASTETILSVAGRASVQRQRAQPVHRGGGHRADLRRQRQPRRRKDQHVRLQRRESSRQRREQHLCGCHVRASSCSATRS